MTEQSAHSLGELLRNSRTAVGLTQEELADAAGVSSRTVSDLERGLTTGPRTDTVKRLADALQLTGQTRQVFVAAARRPAAATGNNKVTPGPLMPAPPGDDPRAWHKVIVAALEESGIASARSAIRAWRDRMPVDAAWLAWVDTLVQLAEAAASLGNSPAPARYLRGHVRWPANAGSPAERLPSSDARGTRRTCAAARPARHRQVPPDRRGPSLAVGRYPD